jgi:iron complex transport system ATP-binding protein
LSDALAARQVSFAFPGTPVLRDLSFTLPEGDFAALLGPNGAGKTTLLRLLSGSLAPQQGSIHLLGRDLAALPPRERAASLAVVPQEARVLFPFTVLEVVLMGRFPRLGILGMETADDEQRAAQCLEEVDMLSFARRPLDALSSGERQRVFIARALAQEPRVLLLDEPTTFLDLKHRLQVFGILSRLNRKRNLSILTISHDLNLAARHCRSIWIVKAGAVLAHGSPAEVLTSERVKQAYETDVEIGRDPRTGSPLVIPYPSRDAGGNA